MCSVLGGKGHVTYLIFYLMVLPFIVLLLIRTTTLMSCSAVVLLAQFPTTNNWYLKASAGLVELTIKHNMDTYL